MKRCKDICWFAISYIVRIILPIFAIFDALFMLLIVLISDTIALDILLIHIVWLCAVILCFPIFLVVGYFALKSRDFRQDATAFYQGKRRLARDNFHGVICGRVARSYGVTFLPIKDGLFRSYALKYHFASLAELVRFMFENGIMSLLSQDARNDLFWAMMSEGIYDEAVGYRITKHPCPCCKNLTFFEPARGTDYICPVCFWLDDELQFDAPNYEGSANRVSLEEARANYRTFGACSQDMVEHVRKPVDSEISS